MCYFWKSIATLSHFDRTISTKFSFNTQSSLLVMTPVGQSTQDWINFRQSGDYNVVYITLKVFNLQIFCLIKKKVYISCKQQQRGHSFSVTIKHSGAGSSGSLGLCSVALTSCNKAKPIPYCALKFSNIVSYCVHDYIYCVFSCIVWDTLFLPRLGSNSICR